MIAEPKLFPEMEKAFLMWKMKKLIKGREPVLTGSSIFN